MTVLLLLSAVIVQTDNQPAAPQQIKLFATTADIQTALEKTVKRHYPHARIIVRDDTFAANLNLREFTVHRVRKDGSYTQKSFKETGPMHTGFSLSIGTRDGRYSARFNTPTTLRQPYWSTYVNAIASSKEIRYWWARYAYGSAVKQDFTREITTILSRQQPAERISQVNTTDNE